MLAEHGVMKTEVVFDSERKTERYLLQKIWDESKPIVSLIMTNPSSANIVEIDMTLHYVISNLYRLGDFGGVDILNMTSKITTKIDTKSSIALSDKNAEYILKSAEKSDKVIIAWGKIGENNKKIRQVQLKLLEKLKPFQSKLHMIASDESGTDAGFHPLAPQIRFAWHLIPFALPEYLKEKPKAEDKPTDDSNNQASSELGGAATDESTKSQKDKHSKKDTQKV